MGTAAGKAYLERAANARSGHIGLGVLDRTMAGSHVIQHLAPLDMPSIAQLRDAAIRIAHSGAAWRFGLVPDRTGWSYAPDVVAARIEEVIRPAPAGCEPSAWLRDHLSPGLPIQVAADAHSITVVYDHALVDATIPIRFPRTLIEVARGGEVPTVSEAVPHPLAQALRQTYLRHPERIRALIEDVWTHRRRSRRAGDDLPSPAPRRSVVPAAASTVVRHVSSWMDHERIRLVARWASAHGIGLGPAYLLLAAAALRRAGVPTQSRGTLIVDLRRYLPRKAVATGNLINGLPLVVGGSQFDLTRFGEESTAALTSGRPLAAAVVRSVRAGSGAHADWRAAEVEARAAVTLSYLGIVRDFERLPWTDPVGPREIFLGADAPELTSVSWTMLSIRRRLHVFAAFRGDVFDEDAVAHAARLATSDPVDLLHQLEG